MGEAEERTLTECKRQKDCYAWEENKKLLKINIAYHYDWKQAGLKSLCLHSKKIGNLLRVKQ